MYMNEFRGSRPPMMTADQLAEKKRRAELNKVDPQEDGDFEDRVGKTTDDEIEGYLDVEGADSQGQSGSTTRGDKGAKFSK
jgi:hypothetical protein